MLATELQDIMFGTPVPIRSRVNLGVLENDQVNIIIHGHEPLLSELILMACQDPEMIEYAKTKGATGINLTGICCTANETLMRQGVRSAGNFLSQELAIATGAVEAMVVDIQCIMQALAPIADSFTTDSEGKFTFSAPDYSILEASHPADVKKLGRQVRNFDGQEAITELDAMIAYLQRLGTDIMKTPAEPAPGEARADVRQLSA